MTDSQRGNRRSWWRYGAIGCGSVVFLLLLIGGGFALTAWMQMRTYDPVSRELAAPIETAPGIDPSQAVDPAAAGSLAPGRVILDISVALVSVEAAPAGEPILVQADFDPRRFSLEQDYTDDGPEGWTYRVTFAPVGSKTLALLRVKPGLQPPQLRLLVPRGVPLLFEGTLDTGHAAIELAGLHVRGVDLDVRGGALDISIWDPLPMPMERLVVRGRKGFVKISRIGNASPRHVDIEQRLGAIDLDLRGAWLRDADVRVDARMGGGMVRLPRDVVIEGLGPRPHERLELHAPTLRMSLTARTGDMIVID